MLILHNIGKNRTNKIIMTITKQFEGFNQEELNFLYETILELAEYGRDKYDQTKSMAKFMKDFSDLTEAHFPDAKAKIIPLDNDDTFVSTSFVTFQDSFSVVLILVRDVELNNYLNLVQKLFVQLHPCLIIQIHQKLLFLL